MPKAQIPDPRPDVCYGDAVTKRLRAMGIRDRPTSSRSPWQNGHAERLIGSNASAPYIINTAGLSFWYGTGDRRQHHG